MKRLRNLIVAAALAAAPAAAQGPEVLPNASGPWSPPETGVSFPERFGDFQRTRIVRYKSADWSVGYDRILDGRKVGTVTIFLYQPANGACSTQFEDALQALAVSYSDASEVSRTAADSPEGGRPGSARRARHRMTAPFDRAARQVLSDTYVYCRPGSPWTIKYRSTWPVEQEDGGSAAPELVRGVDWPAAVAE